jgi:hypothetical protein
MTRVKVVVERVRDKIGKHRAKRRAEMIETRMRWSEEACKRHWLTRWFCGLPARPYTRAEALAALSQRASPYVGSPLDLANLEGRGALRICDALETAEAEGLPLKLTAEEVRTLRGWL